MQYSEHDLILNLPNNVFKKIANVLDRDYAWKKIVDILPIFEQREMQTGLQTPGERLLLDLTTRSCTVKHLKDIFRKCELYDALSIFYIERMKILQQPTDNTNNNKKLIKRGMPLTLDFIVQGVPSPTYFWYQNECLLPEQSSFKLHYNSYLPEMEGYYYCIAVQIFANGSKETLKSNVVQIDTMPELCIIIKKPPLEMTKRERDLVNLKIYASGYPPPSYEWMHKNKVLPNITGKSLEMTCSKDRAGLYRCRIWNCANEVLVQTNITIVEADHLFPCIRTSVIAKVAFLIGNEVYDNQNNLLTPVNDVKELEKILSSMGFLVIRLLNATLKDIMEALTKFCELLVEGAYAIFYYAGHGFEFGEKYLLPVDSPNSNNYGLRDAVSECLILREVLNTKPKLFLLILDMCLASPDRLENSKIFSETKEEIFEYKSDRNLIQCYSTTSGQYAYEKEYNKYSQYFSAFIKFINADLPILKILADTNREFERQNGTLEQQPCISFNVTQDFYLNVRTLDPAFTQPNRKQQT